MISRIVTRAILKSGRPLRLRRGFASKDQDPAPPSPAELQFLQSLYKDYLRAKSQAEPDQMHSEMMYSFRLMQMTTVEELLGQAKSQTQPRRLLAVGSRLRDFGYSGSQLARIAEKVSPVKEQLDGNELVHYYRLVQGQGLADPSPPRARTVPPQRITELLLLISQVHGSVDIASWLGIDLLREVPHPHLAGLLELPLQQELLKFVCSVARLDVLGTLCKTNRHEHIDFLLSASPAQAQQQKANIAALFCIVDYLKLNRGAIPAQRRAKLLAACRDALCQLQAEFKHEELTEEQYAQLWLCCSILFSAGAISREQVAFLLPRAVWEQLSLDRGELGAVGVGYALVGFRDEEIEQLFAGLDSGEGEFVKKHLSAK